MDGHYKQQYEGIMQREVSRVDFLKYMGVALLGVVGIVGFLKNLHEAVHTGDKQSGANGYGRSAYGR